MKQDEAASFDSSDGTGDALVDARLAAIVESSFDAIISKDLDGIITSWNPAAERLFGYTAEEAVGQSILLLVPPSHLDEEAQIIARIRRGERVETFETVRSRKDGSVVPVSLTISPIRSHDGRIVGASKIARDISARKETQRRIRLLLREVNHRVKNQYAVILSMVRETLKHTGSSEEFETKLRERIMSLARSHDLLVNRDWRGASLAELILQQMEPFGGQDSVRLAGPPLVLTPTAVQSLGMAFHELATNSAKYGVLARGGAVDVAWGIEDGADGKRFLLSWTEDTSEPMLITDISDRKGFGSVVLKRATPQSLFGSSTYHRLDGRVCWTLTAPLEQIEQPEPGTEPI
ncbi:PAS domain S-box protein [Chelativorans sp. ZYF759]|jgi:PAS domain S-box-containing protein|uniref:sensor histidine kinase n=1 Tax=Chelativorans sp. ZYF759 TaxID=2692213 RepID=UPI00145D780F|nr:PAS domain S-box protein [Chelativorans sp. ZYF759]NMG40988.1 PAS domain S-box protein [Chelativorans sp. ZYF759]